jgi:hypothetical protein
VIKRLLGALAIAVVFAAAAVIVQGPSVYIPCQWPWC